MRRLRLWWAQPDHFDWLSAYLATRGLTAVTRYLLAAILSMLALATLLMMFSPSGPQGSSARVVSVAVIVGLLGIAVGYVWRWPKRRESRLFSVGGVFGIAVACLVDADPRAGMVGCAAFIGLTGYVGFFHCARYLLLTLLVSLVAAIVCAVRLAVAGDPALALSGLLVMGGGILAVPFCGQVLVHWLSVDALKSSTDALTGLHNRRGFHRAASDLIAGAAGDPARCFSVVMVDLDGFKAVNDTYGHAIGDMILIAVADSLRKAAGDGAVVGRLGGEEFVAADITPHGDVADNAERLRTAIAATSWKVTASLGVASVGLMRLGDTRELISSLIAAADAAMYEAKRAGGNQIRHSEVPLPWLT